MNKKNFSLKEYQASFLSLIKINKEIEKKIKLLSDLLKKVTKNNGKVILFGNGGSASIASHVATDLVKNANIKAICLNETSYLTCLANDFGYEKWITKSIEFHCDKKDLVILISSSGNSPNMIDAAKFCKKKKN